MESAQQLHTNLFLHGYHKVTDPDMFFYIMDMDSYEWLNWKDQQQLQLVKRTPIIEQAMHHTHELVAANYIQPLDQYFEYGDDNEIVNGMDDATLSWHNDEIEGYQLAVLLYWDDTDKDTGGNIEFRDMHTKEHTGGFYPKKFDVCIINHGPRFEHIVKPMLMPVDRRVAMFNFKVNPLLL